ncbi:hypothetical protein [Kutzneria sp. NPDC052558]|uniref:hypothetical protein n=1 Tax=Kutzneria sp. NPDC052558 TaxID=3364121 RepID=UPI0037C8D719
MLGGLLLLCKVDSPQYMLWLLPFLVLLPVRWGWLVGYFVVEVVLGLGVFRWYSSPGCGGARRCWPRRSWSS